MSSLDLESKVLTKNKGTKVLAGYFVWFGLNWIKFQNIAPKLL